MVNLDALAIVSGTISCPEVRCPTHCHNYKGAASESIFLTAHNNRRKNVKSQDNNSNNSTSQKFIQSFHLNGNILGFSLQVYTFE